MNTEKENIAYPIEMYHFCNPVYKAKGTNSVVTMELPRGSAMVKLHKEDVKAMAKHFGLI